MKNVWLFLSLLFLSTSCSSNSKEDIVSDNFEFFNEQLRFAFQEIEHVRTQLGKTPEELPSPRNIEADGSLRLVRARDWCSGFFPGELWYMYEYTKDEYWKEKAIEYTDLLEPLKSYRGTHDLGFMLYCSFGNGYRLNPTNHYKEVLIEGANSLISRFNPTVGCIRSWDHNSDKWQFPVIVDNMMNLEFLFWATKMTGDPVYRDVAIKHADTTLEHHFRADYSSYHVIDYDTITGNVLNRHTHQGYGHETAWARGQAWGLYGYVLCYRETGDRKYLEQAERIANFIFNHPNMPTDLIPYWDFDDPDIPQSPRDVSASTVTASALYELSGYVANGKDYIAKADLILNNLTRSYRVPLHEQHGFLLNSSTGHKPHGTEIDVPIVYADYYFVEALIRKQHLAEKGAI